MPVLIEAINVVIPFAVLEAGFPGGWRGFLATPQNPDTLCCDGELVRTGFLNPHDADWFVSVMVEQGLVVGDDVAVVDRKNGVLTPSAWLAFERVEIAPDLVVAVCRLKDGKCVELFHPKGWSYAGSLSETSYTISFRPFEVTGFQDDADMLDSVQTIIAKEFHP